MMRVSALLGLWLSALVIAGEPPTASAWAEDAYSDAEIRRDVLNSELIVRGVITSIGSDEVPRDSLFVVKKPGQNSPVTIIEVEIQGLIKGEWRAPTIRAVLQGDPGKGAHLLEIAYDYRLGEDVVLCLHYDPRMLGGAYWIWGNSGTFVKRGDSWVARGGGGRTVSIDSVVMAASLLSPERMTSEADAVVLGEIDTVDRREFDCGFPIACIADYAIVRVLESWKGPSAGETILVRAIRRGTNLDWYAPAPPIAPGQEFIMFLKRDSVGFFPFVGFNGFLELHGEQLLINEYVVYPVSRSRVLTGVREGVAR